MFVSSSLSELDELSEEDSAFGAVFVPAAADGFQHRECRARSAEVETHSLEMPELMFSVTSWERSVEPSHR